MRKVGNPTHAIFCNACLNVLNDGVAHENSSSPIVISESKLYEAINFINKSLCAFASSQANSSMKKPVVQHLLEAWICMLRRHDLSAVEVEKRVLPMFVGIIRMLYTFPTLNLFWSL